MPMAASARSQRTPPWRVPMGFACCGPASISMTAWPGSIDLMVKPMRVATGGSGISLFWTILMRSSIRGGMGALAILLAPGPELDGGGECCSEDDEGEGHGGEDPRQAPAEPVARQPSARHGHAQAKKPRREGPGETAGPLRSEVKGEAESEEAVGRTHDQEIRRPHRLHVGISREEPEPGLGHGRCE